MKIVKLNTVVKTINLICGGNKSQRHRSFVLFQMLEADAQYKDLSLHSDVRWLSAGKCLQQFQGILEHVIKFLEDENIDNQLIVKVQRDSFKINFAFLTDITSAINLLNLKLQGLKLNGLF